MITVAYVLIYLLSFISSRGSEWICQNLYLMIKSRSCKPYMWGGEEDLLQFCCALYPCIADTDLLAALFLLCIGRASFSLWRPWVFTQQLVIYYCNLFYFFFYWNKIVLFSRNAFFEIKYVEIFSRCTFVVCRTCMFQNVKPHSHNEHGGSHVTCAQYQSVSGYRYLMIIRYNPGIQIL